MMSNEQWIESLRKAGVKAAHPDDGSVIRDESELRFRYPQYFDNPAIGDVIALGTREQFRFVAITAIRRTIGGYTYYRFRPLVKVVANV